MSLGQKLQQHNLAQQLNEQTLGLAKGINSFETFVPQLGLPSQPKKPGRQHYAEGGIIKGPGTGTSDSIPAKLPVDSAIIPKDKVDALGIDFLNKLEAAAPKAQDAQPQVDANVSNGEFHLSKEAVAYWGKDFVNKLIDNESAEARPDNEQAEGEAGLGVKGYRDGGFVTDEEPSLRERALSGNVPGNPGATDLRGRVGLPPRPEAAPMPSLRDRALTGNVAGNPQAPDLRGRLGMPPNPVAESAPTGQSLRDRVFAEPNPANAMRPGFGRNLPDSSVSMPNAQPMMKGLGAMPRPLAANAVDAGTVGNAAHDLVNNYEYQHPELKSKMQAMFPAVKGYAGGGLVEPQYVDNGIPVIKDLANKIKGVGNAALSPLAAVSNASKVNPNAMRIEPKPVDNQGSQDNSLAGLGSYIGGKVYDMTHNATVNQPQALTKSGTITPPADDINAINKANPAGAGVRTLQGYKNGAPYYNDQPIEHTRDTNIYGPGGINLGANPSAEALNGNSATKAPSLGAYAQSNDNGGAFLAASPYESKAYWDSVNSGVNEAARNAPLLQQARDYGDQRGNAQLPAQNNYAAENQLARDTLNENIRKDALDRDAATGTAAAANKLAYDKLNQDNFAAINEKQYDPMGTVTGETARVLNKKTGRFTDEEAVQQAKRVSTNTDLALQFDSNPDQFDESARARIKAWLATPEGKNALASAKQNKQ